MDNSSAKDVNQNFAFESLTAIRNRLLDLTGRNRLLNFRHGRTGCIRVIDELPDQLASNILEGKKFTFIPVNEPTRNELIEHGYISINDEGEEVRVKADPSAREWAKLKGLSTSYELPASNGSHETKHNDTNIQSLLFPRELEAQLRNIRGKANTALEETGANILYLAFGFLEWFEDDRSGVERHAPLYLIPVKIEKATLNKDSGTYIYTIEHTGEDIISNLSLREKLKHDFHLDLPDIDDDVLPEQYFSLLEKQLLKNKASWSLKRFATLSLFDFGKLLMYLDLDPSRWPTGEKNIQNHAILQQFFAKEGIERESVDVTSFGTEYPIDELNDVHQLYPLIDDADSSQHSALVDAIKGKNLVIEGPPGSGKSQTITNLIAAAMAQGKRVLFVAEKMAALQVVKSRLARAGLGDFCLELHSHKTQKKQVYASINERLNRQSSYRYPNSIDLDIQLYEEKKEKLSNYSNLINSEWKRTGKTIHQIFAAATRFREEFSNVKIDDIRPNNVNGDRFSDIDARRTGDELRRYAEAYGEVRGQLGQNAQLSEHPWFGVYNKSIQVFDSDEVTRLLDNFNTTIKRTIETIQSLSQYAENDFSTTIEVVESLESDSQYIPTLTGHEDFRALSSLDESLVGKLEQYIEQYCAAKSLLEDIADTFEQEVINSESSFKELEHTVSDVSERLTSDELTPTDIYQQLEIAKQYRDSCLAVVEDINTVKQQDSKLSELLPYTHEGFQELEKYLSLLDALEPSLVNRRDSIFDNDALDEILPNLSSLLAQLKPLHDELKPKFKLESLPSLTELKEVEQLLQDRSVFRWLKSGWRQAKQRLMESSTSLKPKLAELIPFTSKLVTYRELERELHEEERYQSLLKHEYKGIATPVDEVMLLRQWYVDVRKEYGLGFGKRVAFATSLFSLPDDIYKGIKHLANSKTNNSLSQALQLREQLSQVFKSPLFSKSGTDLVHDDAISKFTSELKSITQQIQTSIRREVTLREVKSECKKLNRIFMLERDLAENPVARELFGTSATLSPRVDGAMQVETIRETISLFKHINSLKTTALKKFLLENMRADVLEPISSFLSKVSSCKHDLLKAYDAFRVRVELDADAWFQGAAGDLQLWEKKNKLALNNPRWLITWVDFVRLRESLSKSGLEALLRSTERGEIELDAIENIYLYSVVDTLAREIITEKEELAYFSGADQNAVRKQFREYDEKLKRLQQEKIAYQIAQQGQKGMVPGVSSGKVSSYTEMGLIRNEVNKKTRHVPIRQLVKRASKSLIALKPCFMMGPHSVAQYLEPGQVEFDLIVMDEASQIKPEDALGTIARGKQLVVVGDPKQLPPTSFFDKAVESEDDDTTAIEQSESILDVSFPMFNARRLRWHYRSRHESLIAFSNQEFYDSNLIVFPSPSNKSDEFGVKFTHVKTGRFVNQQNVEEAKVIASAVKRHILSSPHESLGVVAMSAKQREQIERCVEELSKEDPMFMEALAENANSEEPLFLKNLENVQGDERDVIYISCTYGPQEAGAAQMPQRFGPINSAAGGRRLNVLFTRSKKRMHVFSSMTEGHILATETSSPGVKALKSFLSFAQTGKLPQIKLSDKEPDSDFEIAVMNALEKEGFDCVPQLGVAGYFIDLAVRDPGQPGRFIMGIECDGATYHSAKSARDRDRLRQSVLENLGWKIKRIWSTDWFKNPQSQLKPIIEELHQLKTEVSETSKVQSEAQQIEHDVEQESQRVHETDSFSHSTDDLETKLRKFEEKVLDKSDGNVPKGKSLLRPAMIDALCEFRPVSKSEFLELIPNYLRVGTAKEHGRYLDQVLNIIAEDEEETAT